MTQRFRLFAGLFMALIFLAACAPAALPPTPTVNPILSLTVVNDKCSFSGQTSVPTGQIKIQITSNIKELTQSGFTLLTLDSGKDIEALRNWGGEDVPPWSLLLFYESNFSSGTRTYTYDTTKFSQNADYKGGPLYLVCLRTRPENGFWEILGAFGPIEIKE